MKKKRERFGSGNTGQLITREAYRYNIWCHIQDAKKYMDGFSLSDEDMMRKIVSTMIRPKLEYVELIWSLHKKMHVLKLERIQRMAIKMMPDLEDLTYEERLTEIQLTTLQDRRDLITIYKWMNKLEETDRKNLIMKRKGEARYLRIQENIAKRNFY